MTHKNYALYVYQVWCCRLLKSFAFQSERTDRQTPLSRYTHALQLPPARVTIGCYIIATGRIAAVHVSFNYIRHTACSHVPCGQSFCMNLCPPQVTTPTARGGSRSRDWEHDVGPHGEHGAPAYNGGLGAMPPAGSRGRAPGQGVMGRSPLKLNTFLCFQMPEMAQSCYVYLAV